MPRPPTSPAQRQQVLTQFRQSGLTQAAFARHHHLNPNTLHTWLRLARQAPQLPAFVEVHAVPAPPSAGFSCQLHLGPALHLQLPALPEPTWLAALVRALAC